LRRPLPPPMRKGRRLEGRNLNSPKGCPRSFLETVIQGSSYDQYAHFYLLKSEASPKPVPLSLFIKYIFILLEGNYEDAIAVLPFFFWGDSLSDMLLEVELPLRPLFFQRVFAFFPIFQQNFFGSRIEPPFPSTSLPKRFCLRRRILRAKGADALQSN